MKDLWNQLLYELGYYKPPTLAHDLLYTGTNGGKYNSKYFFILDVDEGTFILDKSTLRVMSQQANDGSILSINYTGMDFRHFKDDRERLSGSELRKTMDMLPQG